MATYRKRGNTWRAEIRKQGHCLSASFSTKAAAKEWAIQKEAAIVEGRIAPKTERITKTVADAFDRYAEEVSPTKKGARWEMVRLTALKRERFAKLKLPDLTTQDLAAYRDKRLREVSPSTVIRNLNLISAVFTKARKEWGWMTDNPARNVDRPPQPRPRERRISQDEIDRLTYALGYENGKVICTKRKLVGLFFLLAIETGMRLGELCSLDHTSVHIEKRYIQLDETKNGDRRQVPLSPRAVQLCEDFLKTDIRMTSQVASTLFRRAIEQAEITNLHFHDTRHEAITRLSRKLDVLALARTVGHRDLKSLMIYYNETATELAGMLG